MCATLREKFNKTWERGITLILRETDVLSRRSRVDPFSFATSAGSWRAWVRAMVVSSEPGESPR